MSLGVIRKDKEILIFPFLSMIFGAVILISFIAGTYFTFGLTGFLSPVFWVALFLVYLVLYFIVVYFNVAMVGCAMIRLKGGDPTVKDGLRTASGNLGAIFKWALISAIVGAILTLIERKGKLIGKIIRSMAGVAWSIATFFVIPVLIYEKMPVLQSLKRSAHLLKKTWGELIVSGLGLGLISILLVFLGYIPICLIIGDLLGLLAGVVAGVIYLLMLACIISAADKVLAAALYRYATTGKISPGFTAECIKNPWR